MKANYKTIEFIGNPGVGKTTALKNISEHICPKSVLIKSNAFASITKDLEKLKSSIYYELAIKKLEFMDNQNIWKQQSQKEGVKSFFIKQLNIYHTIEKQVKNLNIVDDEGILHNFGEELMKLPKEFEETLSRLFGNRVIVYFKSTNENIINNLEKRNSEYPEAANNFFRLYDGDKNALNKYIDETREKQLRALEFAKKYGAKIHILDLDEDNYLLKLLLIIKQEENQTYKRLHNSSTFYNRTAPLESYGHWNSAPLFNRWQYHKRVFEILETIGLKEDDEALEIGTAGFQVVKNSDTMDQDKRWDYKGKSQTFTHDIRNIPWPLTKKYKVTIALRVFQHLTPNQREAFLEAKKNTEHLIIVVPREYKNKILENSQGIKLEQFIEWNDGVYPQIFEETAMGDLYYFNFTKNIQVEKNKINFTKNLSELLVKINELKNMNEKYVVYGYGTVGKLIHEILGDKIIGYVDMVDPNNHPSLLKSMQFDKVIISILGRESEVTEYLISNFNLDKKKDYLTGYKRWRNVMTNTVPLVSVLCMTYNHENFIEDAINGFLIQETNFPFEVLIHDDASTDSTAKIIKKYEKKYPNIIKPIYQIKNQYSKGLCPLWEYLYPKAKGKYIAICEGDDYWTDPSKLQKQVDYLEAHPEVVISSFDANIVDSDGNKISDSKLPINHHRDYSSQELLEGKAWLLTLNWVYRNINIGFIPERLKVINGDKFFTSILGQHGSSHHHTDINPSVYRMHKGGIWSSLDEEDKLEAHINTYFWMYKYYKRIGNLEIAEVFYNKFNSLSNDLYVIKFNSFNKSIFYSGFSQISNAILDLKQKNYKYIIYGYGSLGKYISFILDKNCIGFIDKNYKKLNRKNIFSPKGTKDLNYDYILISLLGREENIIEELVEKYHIDKDKIVIINGDSKYLL